ncbi:hypothetical protein E4U43_002784 [Claviceps pusilla]|uniref:Carboxypeptidase n=1 Tax=Claviceps pusilla TaxID=123648 RepID=A0A9P7N882_9HYPO|nr:hypothetical protein E4U43_002784 [Claviceps pusilla]
MRFSITALFVATTAAATVAAAQDPKINRLPDEFWDHIVKGSDIQAQSGKAGAQKRLEGQLDNYKLRVREHDPASLGVDKVKQYSGYLDDEDQDKHLFYYPVLLWLNGGPGCSSFIGLFRELGPASIPKDDLKPVNNPYSWNTNANVIFIDQPINVGFSYSKSQHTNSSQAAAQDIYGLMTLFFHHFPEYAKQDFFIAGESYAGHYIPAMAHEILSHKDRNINLKGVAIGNGLTDPLIQYMSYRPMVCGEGGVQAVISPEACQRMKDAEPECTRHIQDCYDGGNATTCEQARTYCNSHVLFSEYRESPYDIVNQHRVTNDEPSFQFLNSAKTKQVLGVEVDQTWEKCSDPIYKAFVDTGDWMKPMQRDVPGMLAEISVAIYAGDFDYISNWLGNRAWTKALDWPGKSAFNAAKVNELRVEDGRNYGNVRAANGLSFVQIYKAGHYVPEYEPQGSLNFINRFMKGEWSKK